MGSDTKRQGLSETTLLKIAFLYNLSANKAGLNQFLNICMPAISKDSNYSLQQINQPASSQ